MSESVLPPVGDDATLRGLPNDPAALLDDASAKAMRRALSRIARVRREVAREAAGDVVTNQEIVPAALRRVLHLLREEHPELSAALWHRAKASLNRSPDIPLVEVAVPVFTAGSTTPAGDRRTNL